MGTISIAHIILHGNENATVDLTGVATDLQLDKEAGNLALVVTHAVTMRGTVGGVLSLSGNGTVTLTGTLFCKRFDRDAFTGTLDENGYFLDYIGGSVFWVYSTHGNLFETVEVTEGGIR